MVEYLPLNDTFTALADPTRRAILQQLTDGPARVTEIAKPHRMSLNSVSKHLRILERANLVKRNIRGRDHWIRFNHEPLGEARDWVDTMLEFWVPRLNSLEALLLAEKEENDD